MTYLLCRIQIGFSIPIRTANQMPTLHCAELFTLAVDRFRFLSQLPGTGTRLESESESESRECK